jgi:hypothetical protein
VQRAAFSEQLSAPLAFARIQRTVLVADRCPLKI